MAMQLDKIFLGVTQSEQRKYITAAFEYLHEQYPTLILPAVGQFSLAKCAMEAGYAPEKIFTSDISLFTSLLGYYYTGQPIDDIGFEVRDVYGEAYSVLTTDSRKVAFLMWLMKTQQLRSEVYYERVVKDELHENMAKHIDNLERRIRAYREYYKSINYKIADLRSEITAEWPDNSLMVMNPPAFKGGYKKMFNFERVLHYAFPFDEFDMKKEYKNLFEMTKARKFPVIWYRYGDANGYNAEEVIYAKEFSADRYDYWLITKPEVLKGFRYRGIVDFQGFEQLKRYKNVPVFGTNDELTENTKVQFIPVEQDIALYYRDLWCHKLGNTGAESYFLIALDGKIFATVGFMMGKVFRLQSTKVFENYGFTCPSSKYPNINRLLMLLITSKEMKDVLYHSTSRVNRVYELNGLRTTCLSKYRKVKLNNGILKLESKEKMKDGVYKLVYDTDWHDRTFQDAVKLFIAESNNQKTI